MTDAGILVAQLRDVNQRFMVIASCAASVSAIMNLIMFPEPVRTGGPDSQMVTEVYRNVNNGSHFV